MIEGRKLHANSMALGLELATGKKFTVLCVWCLEKNDPHETKVAKRCGGPGYCYQCPYTDGPELFIVCLDSERPRVIDTVCTETPARTEAYA